MCGSSYQPITISGPLPTFAASAALGRTSSQVMYSTATGTPVLSLNFLVFAFHCASSALMKPLQRRRRSVAPFSGEKDSGSLPAGSGAEATRPAAAVPANPKPQPSKVRRRILRMVPPVGLRASRAGHKERGCPHSVTVRTGCQRRRAAVARQRRANPLTRPPPRAPDAGPPRGRLAAPAGLPSTRPPPPPLPARPPNPPLLALPT